MKSPKTLYFILFVLLFFAQESWGQCPDVVLENVKTGTKSVAVNTTTSNISACEDTQYKLILSAINTISWSGNIFVDSIYNAGTKQTGVGVNGNPIAAIDTIWFTVLATGGNIVVDGGPCTFTFDLENIPVITGDFSNPVSGTNICFGSDADFTSACTGVGSICQATVTYNWTHTVVPSGSAAAGSIISTYTIPNTNLEEGAHEVYLVMENGNVDATSTTAHCAADTTFNFTVVHKPALGAVTFGTGSSTYPYVGTKAAEICIDGTQQINVTTNNYHATDAFAWEYRVNGAGTWAAVGTAFGVSQIAHGRDITTSPTVMDTVLIDPELIPYGGANMAAELYDVRVVVTTAEGCRSVEPLNAQFQINDRPAIMIIHDSAGLGTFVSHDTMSICAGTDLTLRQRWCNGAGYTSGEMSNPNYSGTTTPNTDDGSGGLEYVSPCNGVHLDSLTWTATAENGSSLTATLNAAGAGIGTNIKKSPTADPGDREVVTTTTLTGGGTPASNVVTYVLEAVGMNGCVNRDSMIVVTEKEEVTFTVGASSVDTLSSPALGCIGQDITLRATCASCTGVITYNWTLYNFSGTSIPVGTQTTVGSDPNRDMTISPIPSGSPGDYAIYEVTATGATNSCQAIGYVKLQIGTGPSINPTEVMTCEQGTMIFTNSDANAASYTTLKVFDADPTSLSETALSSVTTNVDSIFTPHNSLAPGWHTYYFTAIYSGCEDTTSEAFQVHALPVWDSISPFGNTTSAPFDRVCNDQIVKTVGNASGSYLKFDWTATGNTQSGASGPGNEMGTASSAGGGGGYYTWVFGGWFPTLVWIPPISGEDSYSYDTGHPQQEWGAVGATGPNGTNLTLVVTDTLHGCFVEEEWNWDIIECGVPNMIKTKSTTPSGTETVFDTYACLGDYIHWVVNIPPPKDFTPSYEWHIATINGINKEDIVSTDSTLLYRYENNDPDTIFVLCTVYSDTTASKTVIKVLFDTTIISKGFANLYPSKDIVNTVDTILCLNDVVEAEANCPLCRGNIEYVWDNNTSGNLTTDGNDWETYLFSGLVVLDTFDIDLVVRHGEGCVDTFNRRVYVNDLPSVSLLNNGQSINSPVYLCDGDVEVLSVNLDSCLTCATSTYVWNTTANTTSINVSTQGGYYAEIRDSNSCLGVTNTALVIDADIGLNSPVIANPSQICSGGNVTLEVAPCTGCSYIWYDTSGAVIAPTRTAIVNTEGSYYAMVTNAEGCSYPTSILVVTSTVLTVPTIAGTTDSICLGQSSTLSTTPIAGSLYQWYLEGNILSGATTSTYAAVDSGQYHIAVTYPNGCIENSSMFNLFDVTFKPNIVPISTVVCSGSTADLYTDLYPGWQYQWYDDGIPIAGATGSIYSANTPGSHYVEVTTDYNCVVSSDAITITTSSLASPNTSTATPNVCPGEYGEVSVSLCPDCTYQWFNANTGLAVTVDASTNYRYSTVSVTGDYYAIVSGGGCSETSDTVTVTVNALFTPAINTSSTVICDGRTALLVTPSCVGCTYHWLVDTLPVLGAINDTFHLVDDVYEIGDYQIAVDYPNGCTDTSAVLSISDGSDTVSLVIGGSVPLDSVICNGVGETLVGIPASSLTGTYLYTLYLDNTPVTGYSNVTAPTFPGDSAGVYTVQMVNPLGCRALSNILPLRAVDVAPMLTSTATTDPSSVTATAICTDTGTVYLEVSNCPNCSFMWTLSGDTLNYTGTTYTSLEGDTATGIYIVTGEEDNCAAVSNPVTVANLIGSINSNANATDTSICNGTSITLEHAASLANPTLNCSGCSFRWLRTPNDPPSEGSPINGASNYSYITGTPGTYYLELTTAQGCVDTSDFTIIRQVEPPAGLLLNFDTLAVPGGVGTPLASNGTPIDMNNWVFPDSARNANLGLGASSYFTSAPFSGVLPANAGLTGVDSINFDPHDSLGGYHLITYHYDTLGCEFTVQDVLEILPPASITVTNANPASVPYEACVGDVLTITTTYLDYPIDQVWAFDASGVYDTIPIPLIGVPLVTLDTFGTDTVYNTTLVFSVPGSANASYLMLINSVGPDTTYTPFVLIHNTDLSFTGLPNMLCSNSSGITLYGNPAGGTFSIRDDVFSTNIFAGGAVGDTIYPATVPIDSFSNGSQWVKVYYSYTETYTNGNLCPNFDTTSLPMEVKDVRLDSIQYNVISVSQDQELLTNLVYRTFPYEARPNKQPLYTSTFSGSFTSPAGNPLNFLPKNAGVGNHPLTYSIQSGDCINSVTADISVVPAPAVIPIPDTLCRNNGAVPFCRDLAYGYSVPGALFLNGVTSFTDTANIINITSVNGNGALTVTNPNPGPGGISECYTYDPSLLPDSVQHDTLVIEYWFHRDEDVLAIDFDTLDYIIARIYQPIFIDTLVDVSIDPVVQPFYCEEDVLHLLSGTPSNNALGGGVFTLYGGNNQYATGDTLHNNVINPFLVNGADSATTTYNLIYTLDGFACKNSDSMNVTISKGLYPAFNTISGLTEFCDTDPDEIILHNVVAPDTAIWKIGGIPQASYVFPPDPLDPGIHVVELQAIDIYGCTASVLDTFTINALPALAMTPGLATQYCANDPIVDFTVSPSPGCPSYMAPGQYLINENFDSGLNPTWLYFSGAGSAWIHSVINPQGGLGGAALVDTSAVIDDSWMLSDSLDMIAGHTYRLTYMVRTGEPHPACTGICDASVRVMFGTSLNPLNPASTLSATMDFHAIVQSDDTYIRYEVEHYHDPAIYTSGKHFMGFHCFSPPYARSLSLDNVRFRDLTVENCNANGVGYVTGTSIVHNLLDSAYIFNPLATTGNIEIKYIYEDVNGCTDSLVYPITVDTFPIVSFTDMEPSYCENLPTIQLLGSPLGGTFSATLYGLNSQALFDSNLIHIPFFAPIDTAWYPVNYLTNVPGTDYVTYSYTDGHGCTSSMTDTVAIIPMLDSAIIDNALDPFGIGHCLNAAPSVLNYVDYTGATVPGVFYGPGVRGGLLGPGAAMFHPDSAVIDMGHTGEVTITYIYLTSTGCPDTTRFTTEVHAMPDLSFMNLPDSMCLNADSLQVLVINSIVTGPFGMTYIEDTLANQTGTYVVTDTNALLVPNFIVLFDSLVPANANGYSQINVQYTYTADTLYGGCTSVINDSIRVDTVPNAYFQGMQDFYCENEPASILMAFPPYKVGSGYMLIDTVPAFQIDSSFMWIDPAAMVGGNTTTQVYPMYYTYTDTRGCTGEVWDTFEVRPFPRITFSPTFQDTFCRTSGTYDLMSQIISPKGGYFTDNLALTSIIQDTLLNLNSVAGPRLATYHFVDSTTACYNNDSIWLYLFNSPELDFTAYGGCAAMDIIFDGYATNLIDGIDSITSIEWDFNTPSTVEVSPLDTSPVTLPDYLHQYTGPGIYNVTLYVQNQGNCVASVAKDVIVSPSVSLNYFEDFESGSGDWYADQPISTTPNPIWSYSTSLAGAQINDPGNSAWVVLPDSLYGKGQAGWVYSPCFDFSSSLRPMIVFDLWRDALEDIDGIVMEWYNYTTNEWDLLGDKDLGINWYQSDFVLSRPGNQLNTTYPQGWTGRSNGFEKARFKLDQFKGHNNVRLRMAFASSPQTVIDTTGTGYEGAAFDNVWIGERTRNVLVEHFDNVYYVTPGGQNSDVVDQSVYNKVFNTAYGLDVFLVQYQTEIASPSDFVNLRNDVDVAARTYLYGITDDNQIMIDGMSIGTGISQDLSTYDLDYDMLQFPDFDITITTPVITGNTINVTSTVTALVDKVQADYAVHTVVVQDSFTINSNGFDMLSVMRKMLPDASGQTYNQSWAIGNSVTAGESWNFTNELNQASFNPDQLEVIVFIQDMNTKEVFQVQTTQDLNKYIGVGKIEEDVTAEITNMNVYPNPSSDLFNVEFDEELVGDYDWRVIDVTGRILQTGTVNTGTRRFVIDAEKLAPGAYYFVINSETVYAQRKLIVIK